MIISYVKLQTLVYTSCKMYDYSMQKLEKYDLMFQKQGKRKG